MSKDLDKVLYFLVNVTIVNLVKQPFRRAHRPDWYQTGRLAFDLINTYR